MRRERMVDTNRRMLKCWHQSRNFKITTRSKTSISSPLVGENVNDLIKAANTSESSVDKKFKQVAEAGIATNKRRNPAEHRDKHGGWLERTHDSSAYAPITRIFLLSTSPRGEPACKAATPTRICSCDNERLGHLNSRGSETNSVRMSACQGQTKPKVRAVQKHL